MKKFIIAFVLGIITPGSLEYISGCTAADKAASTWTGQPVVVNHPDGSQTITQPVLTQTEQQILSTVKETANATPIGQSVVGLLTIAGTLYLNYRSAQRHATTQTQIAQSPQTPPIPPKV